MKFGMYPQMALTSMCTNFCEHWILHSQDTGQFIHYGLHLKMLIKWIKSVI